MDADNGIGRARTLVWSVPRTHGTPDPEPLLSFAEAVKASKPAGGNAEAAYRTVTILDIANIASRVGRKIRFDPVKEEP